METPRDLPSVDRVLRRLKRLDGLSVELVTNEIRAVLAEKRSALERGGNPGDAGVEDLVQERLQALSKLSLRQVINATGVVLHTNLGRAPLAAFQPIAGYSNLEYDLATGQRSKRDDQLSPLLDRLLSRPAIAVNNNAAAVYLVLNELAAGGEVIVSRGELIEIGDGFRIPEIMARSGASLREVGTTNRTRVADCASAITERTRLLMRVHPSNFHMSGFTSRPALEDLVALGRERGIPVYEDLGSGCLVDLRANGINEPLVQDSLAAGINLVSFSCDKLLGGPQAGIIAGDAELVERIRRNPMYRAFRLDKLIIQSLQITLQHVLRNDWQQIPALRMILMPLDEIRARAERVAASLNGFSCGIRETDSVIGGGSTPDQTIRSWAIELDVPDAARFERRLRVGSPPVIARIERDKVILDIRTVADEEESRLAEAVNSARA